MGQASQHDPRDITASAALDEIQIILDRLKPPAPAPANGSGDDPLFAPDDAEDLVRTAKRIIRLREARRKFLPEGYFEEPAYNILLDLYVATAEARVVYVNDACIASNTPTSTALRWISILVRDGFAVRFRDEKDARRTILEITPVGNRAISDMLRDIHRV